MKQIVFDCCFDFFQFICMEYNLPVYRIAIKFRREVNSTNACSLSNFWTDAIPLSRKQTVYPKKKMRYWTKFFEIKYYRYVTNCDNVNFHETFISSVPSDRFRCKKKIKRNLKATFASTQSLQFFYPFVGKVGSFMNVTL